MTAPVRGAGRRWRVLGTILGVAIFAAVVVTGLTGDAAADAVRALARAPGWLAPVVVVLELASLAALGELLGTVLAAGGERPGRVAVQQVNLVRNVLARTLPVGGAVSVAGGAEAFVRWGVDAARAASALAASSVLSIAVLVLGLPVAGLLAAGAGDTGSLLLSGALLALAVGAVLVGLVALIRHPRLLTEGAVWLTGAVARGPLRGRLRPEVVGEAVQRAAVALEALLDDRRALGRSVLWAVAAWGLDLAALVVIGATIGEGIPLRMLPLTLVVGQLAAAVPITPGGVGVVEASTIALLVNAGAPLPAATAAILCWRVANQWLPVLAGLVLLPLLRRTGPAPPPARWRGR